MPSNIADSAVVKGSLLLGDDSVIQDFVLLGHQADKQLSIGKRATIRSHSVIYSENDIGDDFQTGHSILMRERNTLGNNVSIGSHSVIEHNILIASGVRIHSHVFIPEYTSIGEYAWIGPRVCLTNAKFPAAKDTKLHLKGPTIGKRAKIGANATILPGVHIGEGALIGAGSVVTKDVAAFSVVVGNPAKPVGDVRALYYDAQKLLSVYEEETHECTL